MKKSIFLSQLALAGIAAGLVSVSPLHAADQAADKSVKTDKHGCGGKNGCEGKDTVKAGKLADTATVTVAKHDCAGKNACKGQGGCSMTDANLKKAAKKQGISLDKAGKAHSCKGKNECKGLGGCGGM